MPESRRDEHQYPGMLMEMLGVEVIAQVGRSLVEAAPNATDDGISQGEQAGAEPHPVGPNTRGDARFVANNRAITVVDEVVDPTAAQTHLVVRLDGIDLLQDYYRTSRS